jgi:hypothetical protein
MFVSVFRWIVTWVGRILRTQMFNKIIVMIKSDCNNNNYNNDNTVCLSAWQRLDIKAYGGCRAKAPPTLDLCISWRWVVSTALLHRFPMDCGRERVGRRGGTLEFSVCRDDNGSSLLWGVIGCWDLKWREVFENVCSFLGNSVKYAKLSRWRH